MLDNYIQGFLIGTKRNANGWQVSKSTLPKIVNAFIGKPFTIIPEKLARNVDAHFHGATKQETIDGYNDYSHGTIEKVLGPFPYNDGTDDFYYKHITKLSNSKSASLLAKYGARSKVPFSVSPHIWHEDPEITDYVSNFTPIGISLVGEGAYGNIAVINQMCNGTAETCHRSLGGSYSGKYFHWNNTDENTAKLLSSLFDKSASFNPIMSINQDVSPPNVPNTSNINNSNNNPTLQPQTHLTQEPQKEEKIFLTKEQYDSIQKERQEFESTKKRLEALENEHKTNVLSNIFSTDLVTDETTRNNLVEKWKKVDVSLVKDLYQDFNSALLPVLIDRAKKEALEAAKSETPLVPDTNKSKSASLLKAEPKAPCGCNDNKDKAASASASNKEKINEVALLRKYLFSGKKV